MNQRIHPNLHLHHYHCQFVQVLLGEVGQKLFLKVVVVVECSYLRATLLAQHAAQHRLPIRLRSSVIVPHCVGDIRQEF